MKTDFQFAHPPDNLQQPLSGSAAAARLFAFLEWEEQEVVAAAFLDNGHKLLSVREIFRGTVSESLAQPREILREGLKCNAAKFLVAHNHVSRNCLPSEQDVRFTVRLEWAAEAVGLPLLDHLILARGQSYFSFAEAKLLRKSSVPWQKHSYQ
jgi:DNA repair protein RadC